MSEHDSLAPHVQGIARSKRVHVWIFAGVSAVSGALATGTLALVNWTDRFVKHAELIDIWTGIPETNTTAQRKKLWETPSLAARLEMLECERLTRKAEELRHDHDFMQRYVSMTAATSERSPQHRAEAAAKAVQLFESSAQCAGEMPGKDDCTAGHDKPKPEHLYHCNSLPADAARTALETPVPR